MTDYAVNLTDLAAVKGDAGLEHKVREEISGLMEDGLSTPLNLMFHTFTYEGVEFICYPREGGIEVDTCYREKMDKKLDKGPLAGGTLFMPRSDTGDGPI